LIPTQIDTHRTDCPFCARIVELERSTNVDVIRLPDAFPVSPGHTLVVPVRHEPDLFELGEAEVRAVWAEVGAVQRDLGRSHRPDGFNVGVNVSPAAGQTVPHAHVHVIPRYRGDVADPRGGIRWVLPERAAYWDENAGE